jgi:signal transduction histidine kinase
VAEVRKLATIRARTTLLATAATALVLIAGAFALVAVLSAQLTSAGDGTSRARVQDLLDLAAAGALPTRIENVDDESVAQVIGADGAVLASSPNIDGQAAVIEPVLGAGVVLELRTIDAPDDDETEEYRVWIGSGPSPYGEVTVVVGRSLESVGEASRTLRGALLVGVPLVLALLAVVIWFVVGRALARIDNITTTVAGIGGSDLHRRVPEPDVEDEVGRLAITMNRMLDRLEDSADRQRTFVADASHDLQSPLTALRTRLEVALAHPDRVQVDELARELVGDTTQMETLVQDLLALAAGDDAAAPHRDLLDLDELVLEEVARVRPTSRIVLDTGRVSAAPVRGDGAQLRRLVRNLLDNAVRHAESTVRVSLQAANGVVTLDVIDDGPGVPKADRARIFDRFYRGDEARQRTDDGPRSGLGLAIARQVAEAHGGTLQLMDGELPEDKGAHFRLRLHGSLDL